MYTQVSFTHQQLWSILKKGKLMLCAHQKHYHHHHHQHFHPHHQQLYVHHLKHDHVHSHVHGHVKAHVHSYTMHCHLHFHSHTMRSRPFQSFTLSRQKWKTRGCSAFSGSISVRTYQYPHCGLYNTNAPFYGSSLAKIPRPTQQLDKACLLVKDSEEERLDRVLGRSEVMVTRDMEWANVVVGYQQEHRYVLTDPQDKSAVIGFIIEKSHWLLRQSLRSRRPFKATVTDKEGRILLMLRRPVWFFNSTIFAEIDDKVIGFVRSRWHPWRRICELYVGKKQFASMENPGFWNWTFVVNDETGRILALIDRDYRSWGYETLTDASQYMVRFGKVASADGLASSSIALKKACEDYSEDSEDDDNDNVVFTVDRQLTLNERACTLALVVSLDNDYFSRHSGGAWLIPIPFLMGSGQ